MPVPAPPFAPQPLADDLVRLEPLNAGHFPALWRAFAGHPGLWTWMGAGPFETEAAFTDWAHTRLGLADPVFYAIRPTGGDWCGLAAFLRIEPAHGVIEVGHLTFSPALQGTRAATAAMALMMGHVFALGWRRYEWKCDAQNLPSRRAAQRLGFSYEGIFRQHMVIKGKNRDTAWFSLLDHEWPDVQAALSAWLSPANFTGDGRQIRSLSGLTAPRLAARDPALT